MLLFLTVRIPMLLYSLPPAWLTDEAAGRRESRRKRCGWQRWGSWCCCGDSDCRWLSQKCLEFESALGCWDVSSGGD
ncbi:hypothetical protein C8J56DRAFT_924176 [Mycena floridula]|nr:hypothetical protein C8J56DRAFT_924176 [Mycena floridula]